MADRPHVDTPSRRSILKIATGAATAALGIGILELAVKRETDEQSQARVVLEDNTILKTEWVVNYDQEIKDQKGLSVRPYPRAPVAGESTDELTKLPEGSILSGIVWKGRNRITQKQDMSWVAFKFNNPNDKQDQVGFVSKDYLTERKPVQK